MEDVARVVLAMEQHDVAEEVMHFLDRSGQGRVIATAADDRQLLEALRQLEPDAVVGQPALVADLVRAHPYLAIDTQESIASLRAAIRGGADGFFVWPADRAALSIAVAATRSRPSALERRANVIAIRSSRGGAGATFVATHLARAFARRGKACVLVDADPMRGDVGPALGAPEEGVRTLADLAPLGAELTPSHLDDALWVHPQGFRVLLAPPAAGATNVEAAHVRGVVDVAATATDVVVVHLPHTVDAHVAAVCETADRILEVVCLDVLSFRSSARALEALRPLGIDGRVGFVVNRATRAEITPGDVAGVFGCEPLAVVPFDRGVTRAQDHGRLLAPRGRTFRSFDRLAGLLEAVS